MECYIVKKLFSLLFTGILLSTLHLNAQVDTQDIGSENVTPPAADDTKRPFKIGVSGDYICKAKVKRGKCPLGHVTFATAQAEVNLVYYYQECYEEGAAIALAYDRTYMNWDENPFFDQKNIDQASIILSGFSKRLCDWEWRSQVAINFDDLKCWTFNDYMNYDIVLWGRYAYCQDVGLHIGFWAQTGMKFDRVYPIIGFDWQYDCHWKFNVIFPMNISAVYSFDCAWSVALASRFFDQRHRMCKHEHLPEAIYHYQTTGGEFALNYNPGDYLSANVHAGYNFGGHLSIASRHYHHNRRLRVEGAPYAGAEVAVRF